jgi:elongation factor Ts
MSVQIPATAVKALRDRTGLGMMECQRALKEANGDAELAYSNRRKSSGAKADKRAGNSTAEGIIVVKVSDDNSAALMLECNCQTDFVAKDANFVQFANLIAAQALQESPDNIEDLMANTSAGQTLETIRQDLVAKLGENVQVRRFAKVSGVERIGHYVHGGRIGVFVALEGGDADLAKDIAMHIAASRPSVISPEDVSAEVIAAEKEIYMAQAANSGKPAEIVEKMVQGKLRKFMEEVSLTGQPFVKDPDVTVGALLNKNKAKVTSFERYEVGEGIEKVKEDFVKAVMEQVNASH